MGMKVKRSAGEKAFVIFGGAVLSVFALLCILPLLLVLGSSFSDELSLLKNGYRIAPLKFSLLAYKMILVGSGSMLHSYLISIFVTCVGTALALVVSVSCAYALSRRTFVLRRFFNLYVVFTLLFSAGLVPWYLVCVQILHLKNSIWALILPMVVNGFNVLLLRSFMGQLPEETIESARIDGASEFRILAAIVAPMAVPAIATVGLFYAMAFWNDWWLALLYLDNVPKYYPIQYLLRVLVVNTQFLTANSESMHILGAFALPAEGVKMAACVLAIGPLVVIYPFVQRYFVKGLTLGSVKG
jgi:putative aldouronate transport system permease protein